MPSRPLHECTYPGCHVLVREARCHKHKPDRFRPSAAKRGYGGKRWLAFRAMQLSTEPLCKECLKEGRMVPGVAVDHICPVSGPDDPRFFDLEAVQSLCVPCHARKTASESGFGM